MDEHSSGEELSNILKDRSPYANNLHTKTRGWSRTLLVTGVCTTFGSAVVAGYNIGVMNAPAIFMRAWLKETVQKSYGVELEAGLDLLWAFVVSIFLIGGCIGSFLGSYISNRMGRKRSYLVCVLIYILGSLCFQFCRVLSSVEVLILGRLLVGLASGITTACLPMYLSEIAPLMLRGTLGVFCSMGVTGGVVVAQIVSLHQILGNENLWHVCLSFQIVFLIFFTIPYYSFPESPKYLYLIGDENGALRELRKLCDDVGVAQEELSTMESTCENRNNDRNKSGMLDVLRDPKLLLPLVLVCAMQGGQQLSGINAVFFYSVQIFESIGFTHAGAEWANLGAGILNLFVSFFSPVLMERVNRRPLMLTSCFGCGIFLLLLTIFYGFVTHSSVFPSLSVVALLGYILVYQIGLGPIPYFCGSELFEAQSRSSAMAMGSLASWSCNFLVGQLFPTLKSAMGAFVFLIFAVTCFLLATFLKFYMPETRAKNISDVALLVSNGFKSRPLERKNLTRIHNELA